MKTLSLNRHTHLFVRPDGLYIKLQKPNRWKDNANDIYMLNKVSIDDLNKLRDWAESMIELREQGLL